MGMSFNYRFILIILLSFSYTFSVEASMEETDNYKPIKPKKKSEAKDPVSEVVYKYVLERDLNARQAYEIGKRCPNLKAAFYLFQFAASQSLLEAKYMLGNCYYWGRGVEQSSEKAVHYFNLAARRDRLGEASFMLGICHYWGFGVKQDLDKMMSYFEAAAIQGDINARYYLDLIYKCLNLSYNL